MIWTILKYALVGALALVVFVVGSVFYSLWRHEVFVEPTYDTLAPEVDRPDSGAHILVFTKTNGFRHVDGIPAANQMFSDFAEQEGWTLFFTENAAVHNAEDLAKFDLIVWNNVSGDVLTADQRVAFQTYMEAGGRFLGIHATGGDPAYQWAWHPEELIRAQFTAHPMVPQFQDGLLHVEDKSHPSVTHLPDIWAQNDEWYSFAESPRDRVNVLLSLDEESYSPSSYGFEDDLKMGDHPMVWHHRLGEGWVFYSALGHQPSSYQDEDYRKLLLEASNWLLAR